MNAVIVIIGLLILTRVGVHFFLKNLKSTADEEAAQERSTIDAFQDPTTKAVDSAMTGLSEQIAYDMFLRGVPPRNDDVFVPPKLAKAADKAVRKLLKKKDKKKTKKKSKKKK